MWVTLPNVTRQTFWPGPIGRSYTWDRYERLSYAASIDVRNACTSATLRRMPPGGLPVTGSFSRIYASQRLAFLSLP